MMNKKCVICNNKITGFGHNPEPLATKGRCCDTCNSLVIVKRIKDSYNTN